MSKGEERLGLIKAAADDPDEAHRQAVWQMLDRLRGVKLTSVDASSLVWIEQRRMQRAKRSVGP